MVSVIKLDVQLFSSLAAVKNDTPPMFTIQLNKLHFLKRNTPLLTTYYHNGASKEEFSKVYFKILLNNLTCYVVMFLSGAKVVLFNDALKPHTDAYFRGTKVRFFGASGASSTFGNGLIKMFLLDKSSPTLADDCDEQKIQEASAIKDIDLSSIESSPFYQAVTRQDRSTVVKLLSLSSPLVGIPYASYVDNGDQKCDGKRVTGHIRLFESVEDPIDGEISATSLIIANIMMVLVEQELRKMRGYNKPLMVGSSNA